MFFKHSYGVLLNLSRVSRDLDDDESADCCHRSPHVRSRHRPLGAVRPSEAHSPGGAQASRLPCLERKRLAISHFVSLLLATPPAASNARKNSCRSQAVLFANSTPCHESSQPGRGSLDVMQSCDSKTCTFPKRIRKSPRSPANCPDSMKDLFCLFR